MAYNIIYELITYFDGNTYECVYGGEVEDILCDVGFDHSEAYRAAEWCDNHYELGEFFVGHGFEIVIISDY